MIFINRSKWGQFSEEEMSQYQESVFQYYRERGFPYYSTDPADRHREYLRLLQYDFRSVLCPVTKVIRQTMHGLNLAWSFHPHAFGVRCNQNRTPLEAFGDEETLRAVIRKRIRHGDNMSDSGLRKTLKIFTGVQAVSNFRPTAAAAVYHQWCPRRGRVWDMSGGYGGRMLGAHLAQVQYTCTEPCSDTFQGLCQMNELLRLNSEILQVGSEEYRPEPNSLDFCFTSPPYFNTEQYSLETTQSWVKFPQPEDFREGFLRPTLEHCYYGLKKGGFLALNIANVRTYPQLEVDTVSVAQSLGFRWVDTYRLALSSINKQGFKYEPIFLLQK